MLFFMNYCRRTTLICVMFSIGHYIQAAPHLVHIPISIGELFDKITILEIKIRQIIDAQKLDNVLNEWRELNAIIEQQIFTNLELNLLKEELLKTNEQLWNIEDAIRAKEAHKLFDEEFIELARSIYYTNDRRAAIKRKINMLTCSQFIEEKVYTNY